MPFRIFDECEFKIIFFACLHFLCMFLHKSKGVLFSGELVYFTLPLFTLPAVLELADLISLLHCQMLVHRCHRAFHFLYSYEMNSITTSLAF